MPGWLGWLPHQLGRVAGLLACGWHVWVAYLAHLTCWPGRLSLAGGLAWWTALDPRPQISFLWDPGPWVGLYVGPQTVGVSAVRDCGTVPPQSRIAGPPRNHMGQMRVHIRHACVGGAYLQ